MPLDQDARRYANTLFTDGLEERTREYQRSVVAMRNQAASRGQLFSGNYYSELVRIGVEHIRGLATLKADSEMAAFDRARIRLDEKDAEEIIREATEYCETQGRHLATSIQQKAGQGGMQNVGTALAGNIASEISTVQSELRRRVLKKLYETRMDARNAPTQSVEPEQRDDLLPILPRRQFDPDMAELAATADSSAPLSLLVIDFDHFKSVNDQFGHVVGDEVLVGTALTIKAVCNKKGRCYRWGGDELAVLLPNHTADEALAVATRIRQTVGERKFPTYPHRVTLSMGVASYPGSCNSSEHLFKDADDAARAAKKAGRDQISVARIAIHG